MANWLDELNISLSDDSLEHQVKALIQLLQHATNLESAYFTRIDTNAGIQEIVYSLNKGKLQLDEGLQVPWEDTLCKRALESKQFVTSDVASCWGDSDAAAELGIQTYMSAPVTLPDGQLYGTVCAASTQATDVSAENRTLLELIGKLIGRLVERESLVKQLAAENRKYRNFALVDPLTDVGNRRALEENLNRLLANSQRNNTKVYVAYVDLNNFKSVNDEYGHDAGDRLLLALSNALKQGLREGDFVARVGGDEFVVTGQLTGDSEDSAAETLRQQIAQRTSGDFDIGQKVSLRYAGATVGITIAEADDEVETLLKRADEDMYQRKRSARSKA